MQQHQQRQQAQQQQQQHQQRPQHQAQHQQQKRRQQQEQHHKKIGLNLTEGKTNFSPNENKKAVLKSPTEKTPKPKKDQLR